MSSLPNNVRLLDLSPPLASFADDVVSGLQQEQKAIPAKYFYDAIGSAIFDQVCNLPEYYVTRTELAIMEQLKSLEIEGNRPIVVIEFGGASSFKFRHLLRHVNGIKRYIAVDISRDALFTSAKTLGEDLPDLDVIGICGDYQQLASFDWAPFIGNDVPLVFFPGSTIGNLTNTEAIELLRLGSEISGKRGYFLLGADMVKSTDILIPAYDDAQGITAAFNLNLIDRINRELNGDFDKTKWRHEARFNAAHSKIEMHLVAEVDQVVTVCGRKFAVRQGESIHTEDSRKYKLEDLQHIAKESGYGIGSVWSDDLGYFSIVLLRPVNTSPS